MILTVRNTQGRYPFLNRDPAKAVVMTCTHLRESQKNRAHAEASAHLAHLNHLFPTSEHLNPGSLTPRLLTDTHTQLFHAQQKPQEHTDLLRSPHPIILPSDESNTFQPAHTLFNHIPVYIQTVRKFILRTRKEVLEGAVNLKFGKP